MKAIIIGTSLSGKTTIIRELRKSNENPISEMDEELTRANKGKYPSDSEYKNKILAPKIIEQILKKKDILFFTNTDYFTIKELEKAKNRNFKIIQIDVSREELIKRNKARVKNEGYEDLSKYLDGMLEYQNNIQKNKLVDMVLDGNQSTAIIIEQLINTL